MNKFAKMLVHHGLDPNDVKNIKIDGNVVFLEHKNVKYKLEGENKTIIDEEVKEVVEEVLEKEDELNLGLDNVEEVVENMEKESETVITETVITETVEDDLTELVGVGPKVKEMLNFKGIYTFEKLASFEPKELYDILVHTFAGNPTFLKTEKWINEAKSKIS